MDQEDGRGSEGESIGFCLACASDVTEAEANGLSCWSCMENRAFAWSAGPCAVLPQRCEMECFVDDFAEQTGKDLIA